MTDLQYPLELGDIWEDFPKFDFKFSRDLKDWLAVIRQLLALTNTKPLAGYVWSVLDKWDPGCQRIFDWLEEVARREGGPLSERSESDQYQLVLELIGILSSTVSSEGD